MAFQDMSFEHWSAEVDKIIQKHTGMKMDELIDSDLQSAYESDWSPWEGAVACLEDQDDQENKEAWIQQILEDPEFEETD